MSSKVCTEPAHPQWRDATTIGDLHKLLGALLVLGHDEDTLVTFLHDREHVWLETVHEIEEEDSLEWLAEAVLADWEKKHLEPRMVDELTDNEADRVWEDADGYYWRHVGEWQTSYDGGESWSACESPAIYGPFTEVIGRVPRVLQEITEIHKQAAWIDCDGDRWVWVDGSWERDASISNLYAPYTEVL